MGTFESGSSQVRALANAVSAAFASADLPAEALTSPRITYTDLPWQRPPLQTESSLGGEDLQLMLNCRLNITSHGLKRFWSKTLREIRTIPTRAMRKGVYIDTKELCRTNRHGSRLFAFSTPYGYPAIMEENTGVVLSLEVAKVAEASLHLIDIVSDDNNYIVTTIDGAEYGVRNGLPIAPSPWATPSTGQIQELLSVSRGEVTFLCTYDTIALARSLAFEFRDKFRENYAGVEQALNALRYLTTGRQCPELIRVMAELPEESRRVKADRKTVLECFDVMETSMTDRQKLQTLHQLLVPNFITASTFRERIYYSKDYPLFLSVKQLEKVHEYLSYRLRELGGEDNGGKDPVGEENAE